MNRDASPWKRTDDAGRIDSFSRFRLLLRACPRISEQRVLLSSQDGLKSPASAFSTAPTLENRCCFHATNRLKTAFLLVERNGGFHRRRALVRVGQDREGFCKRRAASSLRGRHSHGACPSADTPRKARCSGSMWNSSSVIHFLLRKFSTGELAYHGDFVVNRTAGVFS